MPTPPDFTTIDTEKVQSTVDKLNQFLKAKKDIDKKEKVKLRYINQNFTQNITKYEKQEVILGERISYSKTDTKVTFMGRKQDHMLNGQLKAA